MQSQFPVSWSGQSASLRRENDVVVLVVKIGRNGKKKRKKKGRLCYVASSSCKKRVQIKEKILPPHGKR